MCLRPQRGAFSGVLHAQTVASKNRCFTCQMPWVRARNFQKGSRGNLGELEVAQVYGAIGAAGVAANQMKTATFISLIFWLVIFDKKTQKTDKSQHV